MASSLDDGGGGGDDADDDDKNGGGDYVDEQSDLVLYFVKFIKIRFTIRVPCIFNLCFVLRLHFSIALRFGLKCY